MSSKDVKQTSSRLESLAKKLQSKVHPHVELDSKRKTQNYAVNGTTHLRQKVVSEAGKHQVSHTTDGYMVAEIPVLKNRW